MTSLRGLAEAALVELEELIAEVDRLVGDDPTKGARKAAQALYHKLFVEQSEDEMEERTHFHGLDNGQLTHRHRGGGLRHQHNFSGLGPSTWLGAVPVEPQRSLGQTARAR